MTWFYGLTIRAKFLIPISIISILVVFMGVVALDRFQIIDKKVTDLREVNLLAVGYLLEADAELHKALVEERSMLFLNVGTPDFSDSIMRHKDSITSAYEKLKLFHELMDSPDIDQLYQEYETAWNTWEQLTKKVATEREANTRIGRTTAIEISFKDANHAFIAMRKAIYALKAEVDVKANEAVAESHRVVIESRYLIIVTIAVSLVLSLLMVIIIPRLVVEPINKIIAFMTTLAGDGGDLTHKIPVAYHDELGHLSESINLFIDSLRGLLVRVIDLGEKFDEQARTLHGSANNNRELAQKQTQEVTMVAGAIAELSTSVQGVASLANNASIKAQQARSHSDQGLAVVTSTIGAIDKLANEVRQSAAVVITLNQDSGNIANVVGVIKSIAEQINLLALNAAIEAARAGEQGRGFAVVADSVRELAFRTAESTQEIQGMISKLQQSAVHAANVMQSSQKTAEDSVIHAGKAGSALEKIDAAIVEMSDLNLQIAAAAEEQSRVSNEINTNAGNIADYATRAAGVTVNVENSAQQLAGVASSLHQELYKFKV